MQAFIDFLSGKKSYILGVLTALFGVMVSLGYMGQEQQTEALQHFARGIEQIIGLAVSAQGLLAIFLRLGISKTEPTSDK